MRRHIDTKLLKRLRAEKGWSQEELAMAASLSARTIQRLEADGMGSTNSVKSIAAALEVGMHDLEEKPRRHFGGARWGYAGVTLGTICAVVAIFFGWSEGGSAHDVGLSLGIVGAIAGTSCGFIGWASARG